MALQGKFVWKGLEIEEAYICVNDVSCICSYSEKSEVKTPEVLNEDGTVKTEAVIEKSIIKTLNGTYTARVYKDKAAKEAQPDSFISIVHGNYTPKHTTTSKNNVAQAYACLLYTSPSPRD